MRKLKNEFFGIITLFFITNNINYNNKQIDFLAIKNRYNNIYEIYLSNHYIIYNNTFKDNNIKKIYNSNVALCTIGKQENLYIKEFVLYYKNLGINKIFLFDNNELDGENFETILKNEIKSDFIEIIDYRGLYKPQKKAFNECYENNKKNFDWIAFYDIDEFLYLENHKNIHDFLTLKKFEKCSSILINWKYYGDDNNIYYNPKNIQERFKTSFIFKENLKYDKYLYAAAKSIVRGGLNITWALFPHFLNNSIICRPNGEIVKNPLDIIPQYSSAFIKHYATKSTEEYIIKLIKGTVNSNNQINEEYINYWIKNYYFLINKKTRKKLIFFKKMLNFKK